MVWPMHSEKSCRGSDLRSMARLGAVVGSILLPSKTLDRMSVSVLYLTPLRTPAHHEGPSTEGPSRFREGAWRKGS